MGLLTLSDFYGFRQRPSATIGNIAAHMPYLDK